jgi:hypothetical protein
LLAITYVAAAAKAHAIGLGIAAVALSGGTVAAAAAVSAPTTTPSTTSTTAAKGAGEAAVDTCRAQLTTGQHGLGACVSAYVKAHHTDHANAASSPDSSTPTEGKSDQVHGNATSAAATVTKHATEGKSDQAHGPASGPGQAAAHRH